jgi:hypothetical protein
MYTLGAFIYVHTYAQLSHRNANLPTVFKKVFIAKIRQSFLQSTLIPKCIEMRHAVPSIPIPD